MRNLLFEIGTEELPARFIEPALESLYLLAEKNFKERELFFEEIKVCGTCRRLTLFVKNLAERQKDREEEILGPSLQIALDKEGNYTQALLGFAKKYGVSLEELFVKDTSKGKYFCLKKIIPGKATEEILPEILLQILSELYFPKKMRWGEYDFYFARPIKWLLSLYGERVIPLEVAGIKSSNFTLGHRFLSPERLYITKADWDEYRELLEKNYVLVEVDKRIEHTKKSIEEVAHQKGIPVIERELLVENAHLVEYPFPVLGSFPEKFLKLPEKLVITTLREHQRYFHLRNEEGHLLPYFIAVNNNRVKDSQIIIEGHERVAKARLEDALFYYERDLKVPLRGRVNSLKGIVYHIKCGTLFEKTERLINLGEFLREKIFPELEKGLVEKACFYAKADLATEVVKEFPSLQGYMGSHYLSLEGEKEIAKALYEQYLPSPKEEVFPETPYGIILSLADKIDHLCALMGAGEKVSGEGDPYALRRAAYGIIKILIEKRIDLPLEEVFEYSLSLLNKQGYLKNHQALDEIKDFVRKRLEGELLNLQFNKNFVNAILYQPLNPYLQYLKLMALKEIYERKEFKDLSLLFKRVTQILKNVEVLSLPKVSPTLLQEKEEKELYETLIKITPQLEELYTKRDYMAYLEHLLIFKPLIDAFFDKVYVMVEEKELRENRLSLLYSLSKLIYKIGDLSYLA
ncbi:MAG: glycine--tRNA ligase subunit beta [Caldimicrobium thiodismutans]